MVAVSGSGQQHGSVWWAQGASELLRSLDTQQPAADSLARALASGGAFSLPLAPIWMDSSTAAECREIEEQVNSGTSCQLRRQIQLIPETSKICFCQYYITTLLARLLEIMSNHFV